MALALTRGKWPAGSLILSHQESESLIGLCSMSQSVALFSSIAAYSQYLLVREQMERKRVDIRWWWEPSPCLSLAIKCLTHILFSRHSRASCQRDIRRFQRLRF